MPRRFSSLPVRLLPGALAIVEARTLRSRVLGLAGLGELPPRVALHLPGCRSAHTFGMRFALDLVWLDRDGAVVRVDRAVPACRVRTCRAARSVLETRAGAADAFVATITRAR